MVSQNGLVQASTEHHDFTYEPSHKYVNLFVLKTIVSIRTG